MPASVRDLWLLLKAQDLTNRALNSFSRNVRNAGEQAAMANLQARKAAELGTIQQSRLNNELRRAEVASLAAQKAINQQTIIQRQSAGASQAEIDQLRARGRYIDQEINSRRLLIGATGQSIVQGKQNVAILDREIDRLNAHNKSIQDHEKNLAHLAGRMQTVGQAASAMGFTMSVAGGLALISLKKAIDISVEYERQVRFTATQVSDFSANLQELGDIGRRVARDIAVPFQQIQPALFDIFSSMDVNVKQAEQLLRAFSKAAVAGQVDISEVSRATIGLLNAFHRPAADVNKLLDIQFRLIQKGIGTYKEWNERIGLVSPSAIRAGQSIEMMMAALAAATRFGLSAARAGTAVSRAFDALSNPNAVRQLKNFGVSVVDAAGNFRPLNEVLRDFRTQIQKMPKKGQAAAIEKIIEIFKGAGGTIEARRFLQAILLQQGNLEQFDAILGDMANSTGSLDQAYGLMATSVSARTQMLKNQWTLLAEAVGKNLIPIFTKLIAWVTNVVEAFNNLSPANKRIITTVTLIGAAMTAILGPIMFVVGAVAAFAAAIAVAGTAIAVTLGVMAGVIVIVAGLAAALIVAWKNSEGFRNAISKLGSQIVKLKDAIVSAVAPIVATFERDFFPKIKEAWRILVDFGKNAILFVAVVIKKFLVPALQQIGQFWRENQNVIRPFIKVMGQVAKWVIIVAALLTALFAGGAIAMVVAAIATVVVAFMYFITIIQAVVVAVKWLIGFLINFGEVLGTAFITAWNAIAAFFSTVWNRIVSIFMFALNFLLTAWKNFWGTFGGLIKAVWDLIVAAVMLGITTVLYIVMSVLDRVRTLWNAGWDAVRSFFVGLWNGIVEFWKGIWDRIFNHASSGGSRISSLLSNTWNRIKGAVSAAWNDVVNIVGDKISKVWQTIRDTATKIVNTILDIGQQMYRAGQQMIQNLVDGLTSKIKALTDKINEIARIIADHIPHSPAKRGPLSGKGSPRLSGVAIATELAAGLRSQSHLVAAASNSLARQFTFNPELQYGLSRWPQTPPAVGAPGTMPASSTVVNVYPKTVSQDPNILGAEIGWQIQNRVGVQ